MKLSGRRKSNNVATVKSARARHIHESGTVGQFVSSVISNYEAKGPTEKQIKLNKRLGSGMPNARSLKRDRPKKKGK